jgi:signal-transduction protein with cAMP-binding, CBS, and nucleotidyltransferase domain
MVYGGHMANTRQQLDQMIDSIEQMREAVRGMVASLVDDGFSEDQAREIVTGIFRSAK